LNLENDPDHLEILDAEYLDADKNLDNREGYQSSEKAIEDECMDNNAASFNTEVQEPKMVDLETTMNNKFGVISGHYTISDQEKKDPPTMEQCIPVWLCNDSVQHKSMLETFWACRRNSSINSA